MIRRMGLVVHAGKPAALAAAARVREWARHRGTGCVDMDVWSTDPDHPRRDAEGEAAAAGYPDLIVTVGGDGTLLRGVRIAAPQDIPVLGIDVGRVGFLTEVETGFLGMGKPVTNIPVRGVPAARNSANESHSAVSPAKMMRRLFLSRA